MHTRAEQAERTRQAVLDTARRLFTLICALHIKS